MAADPGLALAGGPARGLKRGASIVVAYSGGLDSTVLLHLLAHGRQRLRAVHVNHGLQADAAKWEAHCRRTCKRLGVPLEVVSVEVDPNHSEGPEAAAREARYAALRGTMRSGDWLATAHHQDDQAETVLLRLLRGAGVRGMSAMAACSDFGPGHLWRPLLGQPRGALQAYAREHRLKWVEDAHNANPRFSRSYLRSEVVPRLAKKWPEVNAMLARTAAHSAEATQLLDELAATDLVAAGSGAGLSVRALLKMSSARRNNLLRWWAGQRGFQAPPFETLKRLEREVLNARVDATPILAWSGVELRRYRNELVITKKLPAAPADVTFEWDGRKTLRLPEGCGTLQVRRRPRDPLALQVGFPKGGERIKPAGSRHTRTLKKLWQEAGVPPWVRERTPIIHCQGDLAAVADRWRTDHFASLCAGQGFEYRWVSAGKTA